MSHPTAGPVVAHDIEIQTYGTHAAGAPVALICHGVGSSPEFVFDCFQEPLATLGYDMVSYDIRGHGATSSPPDPALYALDRHVSDFAAVADAVKPDIVGGVSLGAHVAIRWASGNPTIDAVIPCSPAWTGRAIPGVGPHAALASEIAAHGTERVLASMLADPDMPSWLAFLLDRDWRRCDPAGLAAALIALDGAEAPTAREIRSLTVPVAAVGWPDDEGHPVAVARDWARLAPRSAFALVSLDELGNDRRALGRAAAEALQGLDVKAGGG